MILTSYRPYGPRVTNHAARWSRNGECVAVPFSCRRRVALPDVDSISVSQQRVMERTIGIAAIAVMLSVGLVGVAILGGRRRSPAGSRRHKWMTGAVVSLALVLTATLVPGGEIEDSKLRLDPRSGLDELQAVGNIILFLPFGAYLALLRVSRTKAILLSAGLALIIETVQFFVIEGRYAATSDVFLNAAGATFGHLAATWRGPARGRISD